MNKISVVLSGFSLRLNEHQSNFLAEQLKSQQADEATKACLALSMKTPAQWRTFGTDGPHACKLASAVMAYQQSETLNLLDISSIRPTKKKLQNLQELLAVYPSLSGCNFLQQSSANNSLSNLFSFLSSGGAQPKRKHTMGADMLKQTENSLNEKTLFNHRSGKQQTTPAMLSIPQVPRHRHKLRQKLLNQGATCNRFIRVFYKPLPLCEAA